MIFETFVL
jgi:hypothetical protein